MKIGKVEKILFYYITEKRMTTVQQLKRIIVQENWSVKKVPEQYVSQILNWLKYTNSEICKTGWPPSPKISQAIKELSIKNEGL